MHLTYKYLLLIFLFSFHHILQAANFEKNSQVLTESLENPGSIEKPSWFKNSFLDIAEDIQEARENDKLLMIYFYQDGCPYCKKLIQDNFGNTDIADLTREHFDVIAINMWGDREVIAVDGKTITEKTFSAAYKVQFTPSFLILDSKGKKLFRMNGYYHPGKFKAALSYVRDILKSTTDSGDKPLVSFREYYAKQPQVKASGRIHQLSNALQPPLNLSINARETSKPLLVLYEQKQCPVCDELHQDILKRPQIKSLLNQFEIVILDMWSEQKIITTDNQKITIKQWANQLNIQSGPSFIFFDSNNKEVFRADGYLKAFHTQGIMDYVLSKGYITQPKFQRWLGAKADALEAQGIHVDLWE
ncbi:MAG: thioredoxin fold domain-containing protein [Gammaproteobacteria bacterium]|nr:thioredoxin fold domain-containing protein [Gammaproteobacteria bacterium]